MPPLPRPAIGEESMRRVVPGRAGHAAAGMRAGTAEVETFQGHPIIRRADHRPGAEQLIEPHLAMEDVSADEPEPALEIERRVDLAAEYRGGKAGRAAPDARNNCICRLFALPPPAPPPPEVEAEMLAEERRNMLALGRQGRIQRGRDQHLDDRLLGP